MRTLIIEPFFTGSHALWAEGYARHSRHDVGILKLSGNHWKWRMHGGAITLARRFMTGDFDPDLLVATDMLDLTTFLALTRERTAGTPTAVYFHENQITYPWSPKDRDRKRDRDRHYGFINLSSALAADRVFFNSRYHRDSFLDELPRFLARFPDHQELGQAEGLAEKSAVLALGLDLAALDLAAPSEDPRAGQTGKPSIVWNHRWEYDKCPDEFFAALEIMAERGHDFEVVLLGEAFDVIPDAFSRARQGLGERIVHTGYADDRDDYARWLWRSDILPVTSIHDFFGASVIEASYCRCFPILPARLAYPELVPRSLAEAVLYDDFDGLVRKLDGALSNPRALSVEPVREAVARFDWQAMAPVYDKAFEELAGSN